MQVCCLFLNRVLHVLKLVWILSNGLLGAPMFIKWCQCLKVEDCYSRYLPFSIKDIQKGGRPFAWISRVSRRRLWHPTPVLLPGKSHGRRSLEGCSPWGRWDGHDWATSLSLFTFTHWRRKWQPTPGFLPGESQGRGSLVGCRLWGRTESDTTEAT